MKTQILQLEPHDDIISARDKMGWSQTGRILLVWPKKGRVLNTKIDLVLLQRHSEAIGAQLALVSRDSEVRHQANRLGIPTFKDVRRAKRAHWRVDKRVRREMSRFETDFEERKKQTRETMESSELSDKERHYQEIFNKPVPDTKPLHPLLRIFIFILGIVAIFAIATVLYPSAQISLEPISEQQDITLGVQADPNQELINLSGILPARSLRVIVDGSQSSSVDGIIFIPDQPATGRVVFTNITEQAISIPEGTIITTEGAEPVRFATTRSGTLSAGFEESITLPIQALQSGERGNLPAGSLIAIEGPLGLNLTATNPSPTQGGNDRPVKAPEEEEYTQLFDELSRELYFKALGEAEQLLSPDDLMLMLSPQPARVLEEVFDPIETQPSDHISLKLSLEFTAWYVSGDDIQALTEGVLDANLSPKMVPIRDTLQITHQTEPRLSDDNVAKWQIKARREVQLAIDESQAASLILGMPVQKASERIAAGFDLADEPNIQTNPIWWRRMPLLPFRISFDIQN